MFLVKFKEISVFDGKTLEKRGSNSTSSKGTTSRDIMMAEGALRIDDSTSVTLGI